MAKAKKPVARSRASLKRASKIDWAAVRARLHLIADALELPPAEIDAALKSDHAIIAFADRYNQSLDYMVCGDLKPMIRGRHRAGGEPADAMH